ncbi:MAG TPA: hypothetical protein VM802_02730, partial [Chitinophaga sp.]|uniref:hypothetical protein n=1 Tax=Chitinophaga sp. TaxID=1869181 RepID=UPI002CDA6871
MKKLNLSSAIVATMFVSAVLVSCKKNEASVNGGDTPVSSIDARAEVYHPQYMGSTIQAFYRGNPVSLLEIENGRYLL